jgi:cell division protein FtsL
MSAAAMEQGDTDMPRSWLPLLAGGACLLLTLFSAFGVVASTHACRELYTQLQTLEARRWALQEEYSRLLLEQSLWASHHRVEQVAEKEMNMQAPAPESYRLVGQ